MGNDKLRQYKALWAREKYRNNTKTREQMKKNSREWKRRNRKKLNAYQMKYYYENPDKWKIKYKEKKNAYMRQYRKTPLAKIKHASRARARYKKLRDCECSLCDSSENLHFHHTDYTKDKGITVCRRCHHKIHIDVERSFIVCL